MHSPNRTPPATNNPERYQQRATRNRCEMSRSSVVNESSKTARQTLRETGYRQTIPKPCVAGSNPAGGTPSEQHRCPEDTQAEPFGEGFRE